MFKAEINLRNARIYRHEKWSTLPSLIYALDAIVSSYGANGTAAPVWTMVSVINTFYEPADFGPRYGTDLLEGWHSCDVIKLRTLYFHTHE